MINGKSVSCRNIIWGDPRVQVEDRNERDTRLWQEVERMESILI